ncbi:TolC family protein [candidate division KSB1 bacterium]|nr:MAG: TolC family protein [candidate division KSB1 bacterium]
MHNRQFKTIHHMIRPVFLAVAIFLVNSFAAARQLTWDEAWGIAGSQNATLLNAKEDLVTAREQVNEARSAAFPTISLSGQYTRNIDMPVFFINGMPMRIGEKNTYAGIAEIRQPIWVAGKVGTALKIAKSYLAQTEVNNSLTKQNVYVELAQSFYGTILARELVKTSETALQRATDHRDKARLMFAQGVVSEYDKIRAEVQAANLEPQVLEARNQYALSLSNLKRMLNLPEHDSLEIVGSLELADTTVGQADTDLALRQRGELLALQHGRQMQKQLLSLAKRDLYLPVVYASANYQTQSQSGDFKIGDYTWVRSSAAMLQVSIPLFDGFRTPSKVKQYKAALRKLDYTETDLRAAVKMDVDNSRRELERAVRTVIVQEDNVHEAQRGYDIAKVRYESGVGTQLELLDAEFQLDQAKVLRLKALYDARIARVQLQRALGTPFHS